VQETTISKDQSKNSKSSVDSTTDEEDNQQQNLRQTRSNSETIPLIRSNTSPDDSVTQDGNSTEEEESKEEKIYANNHNSFLGSMRQKLKPERKKVTLLIFCHHLCVVALQRWEQLY
jgi:hypothetical protein